MNKQGFIFIILLLVLAGLIWQVFLPYYGEISLLLRDRGVWQEKLNDTAGLNQKLKELEKKYKNLGNDADRMAAAVPQNENISDLLIQLEALTSQNGLILNSISFSLPSIKNESAVPLAGGEKEKVSAGSVKNTYVALSMIGSQSALKNFLIAVENNLRLMDINSVSFSGSSDGSSSEQTNFDISFNTYTKE